MPIDETADAGLADRVSAILPQITAAAERARQGDIEREYMEKTRIEEEAQVAPIVPAVPQPCPKCGREIPVDHFDGCVHCGHNMPF